MKVDKICKNILNNLQHKDIKLPVVSAPHHEDVIMCGHEINASYSKAIFNIENKTKDIITESKDIISKFLEPDEHISNIRIYTNENVVRLRAGKEYEGFKGLYKDDKYASCYFNNNGKPIIVLIKDTKKNEVKVIDLSEDKFYSYNKSDMEALHYYKYHPDVIHAKLRFGADKYSGSLKEEMEKVIEDLTRIFADNSKLFVNKEKRVIYRGLQYGLSDDVIAKFQKTGEILTEKSFCSTTTDINVAKRFAKGNPVMQIELPAGAKYVDIEKLFNIDSCHWHESELLLNKGSKFRIKGFDVENNIIKVEYIPE